MQEFCAREWKDLRERTRQTADYLTTKGGNCQLDFATALDGFVTQETPRRYEELLDRYRQAAQLAVEWQDMIPPASGCEQISQTSQCKSSHGWGD